jgi:hypothetical protein
VPASLPASAPAKQALLAQVRPASSGAATPSPAAALDLRPAAGREARLRLHTTRTLPPGWIYDADLHLEWSRQDGRVSIAFDVARTAPPSRSHRVEIEGPRIVAFDGAAPPFPAGSPPAIADLDVEDVARVFDSAARDEWLLAGVLQHAASDSLWVFTADWRDSSLAPAGRRPAAGVLLLDGRSAPRAILVYDAHDTLLRTYEDFRFAPADGGRTLAGFRVSSTASGSHTLFTFDRPSAGTDLIPHRHRR